MPKLVKNAQLTEDHWQIARSEEEIQHAIANKALSIIPVADYLKTDKRDQLAFFLNSDSELDELKDLIPSQQLIAIDFPVFMDGRGFSIARELREKYEFKGEIRAIGNFIPDQMHYLRRCGFDAFLLSDEANVDSALERLHEFSECYQAAVDEAQPLFRRRV